MDQECDRYGAKYGWMMLFSLLAFAISMIAVLMIVSGEPHQQARLQQQEAIPQSYALAPSGALIRTD